MESVITKKRILLEPEAAGKELGSSEKPIPPATLTAWRHRGFGPPFIKIGRLVYYDQDDLDTWIESRKRNSTSDQGAV